MKRTHHATAVIGLSLLAAIAFAPHVHAQSGTRGSGSATRPQTTSDRGQTLQFRKGTLVEVALLKIKAGAEGRLQNDYFARAIPLAAEYGGKPIGQFSVDRIDHGDIDTKLVVFFEWPDIQTRKRFAQDQRFQRIRPIRDESLDELRFVWTGVEQDTTVMMSPGKMYEVYGVWINKTKASHLQDYFKVAGPYIASRGAKFLANFSTPTGPDESVVPDALGFVEWPSESLKRQWFTSQEFKNVGWNRALAVDRLFVVEGSVR